MSQTTPSAFYERFEWDGPSSTTRIAPSAQLLMAELRIRENLDRSPARIIEHPFFTTASFTGEVDAAAGVWKPTPTLREQYPRGLDGCWLVDEVAPERSREECDDDAADLDGFSA